MANEKHENASFIISLWKSVNKIVKENGFFNVLSTTLLMVMMMFGGYVALNPESVFKAFDRYEEKRHNESIQRRLLNTEVVNHNLDDLREGTGAARAIILEFHNGRQNLGNLSFNYCNITYESLRDSVNSLAEEFNEFSIDRFKFIPFLCKAKSWSDTTEELANIDPSFAHKISIGGSNRIYATSLHGQGQPLGIIYIGFWPGDKVDDTTAKRALGEYSAQIAPYLIASGI